MHGKRCGNTEVKLPCVLGGTGFGWETQKAAVLCSLVIIMGKKLTYDTRTEICTFCADNLPDSVIEIGKYKEVYDPNCPSHGWINERSGRDYRM